MWRFVRVSQLLGAIFSVLSGRFRGVLEVRKGMLADPLNIDRDVALPHA